MYKLVIFLILPNLLFSSIYAQTKNYKTWVHLMESDEVQEGFLESVEDSTIKVFCFIGNNGQAESLKKIYVHDIRWLKFRKKGKIDKSIGIGALIGGIIFGLGAKALLAEGDNKSSIFDSDWENRISIAIGFLGAGFGGIIGGLHGAAKIYIPINGSQKQWESKKDKIKKYL